MFYDLSKHKFFHAGAKHSLVSVITITTESVSQKSCRYFTFYKTIALIYVVYFSKISHHTTFEDRNCKWR